MSLKSRLHTSMISDKVAEITDLNLSEEIAKVFNFNKQKPDNFEPIETFYAFKKVEEHLYTPTCLLESTRVQEEADQTISSQPIPYFYFCSGNELTIGYGSKIECRRGVPVKEGLEVLAALEIRQNGRLLTMDEKLQLVADCYAKRNERDALAAKRKAPVLEIANGDSVSASTPTCEINPRTQTQVLYDGDIPVINKENAIKVAHMELESKLNKALKDNPNIEDSYFSQVLTIDFAYQFGNTGVKSKSFYKKIKGDTFPNTLGYSDKTLEKDTRAAWRELVCKMMYRAHQDKVARKGRLATPKEQAEFCIYGLKEYTKMFRQGIMNREPHKIILMEEFMTLTIMQSMRDGTGKDLTLQEVQEAQQKAHTLVYDTLFHNPTIQQLPNQIRPITIITAIEKLPSKVDTPAAQPTEMLNDKIQNVAQEKLDTYNKKNKTNIQLTSVDNQQAALDLSACNDRW